MTIEQEHPGGDFVMELHISGEDASQLMEPRGQDEDERTKVDSINLGSTSHVANISGTSYNTIQIIFFWYVV